MNSKRERILNKVLKYLSQSDNTRPLTVSNLAQDLNIGKSTIYEYFDHKEALIIEAIGLLIDKNLEMFLDDKDLMALPFEQAFKSHLKRLYALAKNHEMLQDYQYHYEISKLPKDKKKQLHKRIRDTLVVAEERLETILNKGIKENIIKPLQDHTRLNTIKAMIFGVVVSICDPYNDWEVEAMFEDLFQAIITLHR